MVGPETHPFVVPRPVVPEALPVVVVMRRALSIMTDNSAALLAFMVGPLVGGLRLDYSPRGLLWPEVRYRRSR
jgi:hypothetical protein